MRGWPGCCEVAGEAEPSVRGIGFGAGRSVEAELTAGPQGLLGAGSLARVVWGRGVGAGAEPEGRKRTEPGVPQAARHGRSGPPAPAAVSGAPGWRAAGRRALGRSA